MDALYFFELDERYFINSFTIRAETLEDAIATAALVLGDSILRKVVKIKRLD